MAGFPHHRATAVTADQRGQAARAFDVENDVRAGVTRHHVLGEEHQQPVRVDDGAGIGHHADAITVAIKSQADVGFLAFNLGDQVGEVFRLAGIGMVVGEVAVHFAVQRNHRAAQRLNQLRGDHAGHTVTAVDHHAHGLGHGDVIADVLEVALQHVDLFDAAHAADQVIVINACFQRLDLFVGQGVARDNDFETVVIRRVVAAGEHHCRFAGEHMPGEVHHGGRHHADIADVAAAVQQALDQLLGERRAGQASVSANGNVGLALGDGLRTDGTADPVGRFSMQGAADYTANVVGAEDIGRQFGGVDAGRRWGRFIQAQQVLIFVENVDVQNIGVLKQRVDHRLRG